MRGRRDLAVAVLILPVLALLCLGVATALLGDAGHDVPRAWAALRHLPAPIPRTAGIARRAIAGGALVAAVCAAIAVPLGWALGRLPPAWAAAARAMLWYPALTLAIAWLLAFAVQLRAGDPLRAAVAAAGALHLPAGPRLLLPVLLAPPLAGAMAAAWRRPDRAALRAAETLGVAPLRVFAQLVLPDLVGTLADGVLLAFLAAAAVLAVPALAPAAPVDAAASLALGAVAAALALGASLLWRSVARIAAS